MDKKGVGVVLIVVFLAIFGGIGFLPTLQHNIDVQENEPVTATIVDTDIDVRTNDDDEKEYSPVITYEYEVNGQTYRNDNVYPGGFTRWHDSRGEAQSVVDEHPVGSETTVHYRPGNPGKAYLTNNGWPGSWYFGIAYAVVATLTGGWLIRKGFTRWRHRNRMRNTPTESVQALSIGPSEIKGTAVTEDQEPLRAPFSGEDCVLAKYEIEEYDDEGDDSGWETVEDGTLFTPFYVDDGTGEVLVRPDTEATYDLDPEDWTETYVDSSGRGPKPIRQFVERQADLGFPGDSSGKDNDRKYRQNIIRDGESVYVFGTVHPRDSDTQTGASNADRLVVQKVDDDGALSEPMFLISDDNETNLTDRRRFALWRAPVGGLFLVVAFFIVLGTFAPHLGLTLPVWF
jgi:hypothetical protein